MPKIQADTVAEHHAQQRRALVSATRALLAESGRAPSMSAIGQRAGLARSSVYQYFGSAQELLAAVVADVFPDWARQVHDHLATAHTPGERIWAYVEANFDLLSSSEQAIAHVLRDVVDPEALRGPMIAFHEELARPLHDALVEFGEPDVNQVADMINALITQTSSTATEHRKVTMTADERERHLARLRRVLGGYLGLPPVPPVPHG